MLNADHGKKALMDRFTAIVSPIEIEPTNLRDAEPVHVTTMTILDVSGGCFRANSKFLRYDDSIDEDSNFSPVIEAKDILPGMFLMTNKGPQTVEIVVKTFHIGNMYIVDESVCLTGYHPYRINGVSKFPAEQNLQVFQEDDYVYDVIMSGRGNLITTSGVEVATLGHGEQDPIFKHKFFGTEEVVDALKSLGSRYLTFDESPFTRDEDGTVSGLT